MIFLVFQLLVGPGAPGAGKCGKSNPTPRRARGAELSAVHASRSGRHLDRARDGQTGPAKIWAGSGSSFWITLEGMRYRAYFCGLATSANGVWEVQELTGIKKQLGRSNRGPQKYAE